MIAQKFSHCDTTTENLLIDLFHDACRVCMGSKGPMLNLFSADDDLIELNVKLYTCVPTININEEGIPKQICKACVKKLRIAYKFRQSCINTTQNFMRYINKSSKKVKTYSKRPNKNVSIKNKTGLTFNIMDVDTNILFKDNPEMYSNRDKIDVKSINTSNESLPSTLPETQCCNSDSLPCNIMYNGHSDTINDLDLHRVETLFDKHIVLDSIPEKFIDHSMYDCNLYNSEAVSTDLRYNSTESVSTSYKFSNYTVSTTSPVMGDSNSKILESNQVPSDDDQTAGDSNSCISNSENKSSDTPTDVITRVTTKINQNETKSINISYDFAGFNHSEIKFSNDLISKLVPPQDDIIMLLYKLTEMKKIKNTTPKIKYKNTNLIKGKQLIISSQEISDSQNISTKIEKNFKKPIFKPIRKRKFLDMNISQKISNYLHNFKLQRKSRKGTNLQGKRKESVNEDVNKTNTNNSLETTTPEKNHEPDIQTVSNIEEINLIDTIKTEPEEDNILENENNLLNYQPFEEIGKYEESDNENELTDDYFKEQGVITTDCTNHNDHNYCVESPKQANPYKTITTYEKIKNPENVFGLDEFIFEPLEKFTHETPCKCSTGKRLNVLTQIDKFYNDNKDFNKQKIFVKSIETLTTKPENQKNKKILKNPKFLLKSPKRNKNIKQKLNPKKSETKNLNSSDTSAEDENLTLHDLKRKITDTKQKAPIKRERKPSINIKQEIKEPVKIKNLGKLVDVETIADFTSIKINETTNEEDFDNPYVCELCNKGFQSLKKLETHLTTHVSDNKTDVANITNILMQQDSQNDTNFCKYCNRKFRTAAGLFTHKYKNHVTEIGTEYANKNLIKGQNEEVTCNLCQRRFASEKYLKNHIRRFH